MVCPSSLCFIHTWQPLLPLKRELGLRRLPGSITPLVGCLLPFLKRRKVIRAWVFPPKQTKSASDNWIRHEYEIFYKSEATFLQRVGRGWRGARHPWAGWCLEMSRCADTQQFWRLEKTQGLFLFCLFRGSFSNFCPPDPESYLTSSCISP